MNLIYVIGMGIEGPGSLSGRALSCIEQARTLVAGRRHLAAFNAFAGQKVPIAGGLERVAAEMKKALKSGHVAVLATGDPLLFGIGRFIIDTFGRDRVEVLPGVSMVQEAFSRIREPWEGARILSVHGGGDGSGERGLDRVVGELLGAERAAVYTDGQTTPAHVARALIDRLASDGADAGSYTAWVAESLGAKDERVTRYTLPELARKRRFAPLNILCLVRGAVKGEDGAARTGSGSAGPRFYTTGIPDSEFTHSSGMITKSEIRAIVLSKLAPGPTDVVWDIGSCTGSVAIEAALASPGGSVFAVEKNLKRVGDIRANIRRLGVENVRVVTGAAPDCMKDADIPAPNAVFVGGGGADITKILAYVARRLRPGGRVVVNSVTMDTTGAVHAFFDRKGWASETVLASLARTRRTGGLDLLSANNPVFITIARRGN